MCVLAGAAALAAQTARLRYEALLAPAGRPIGASALNAEGGLLAIASDDGSIEIWRTDGGSSRTVKALSGKVRALAFDPAGELWVAGDGELRTVNVATGQSTRVPGTWPAVAAMAVSRSAIARVADQSPLVEVVPRTGGPAIRTFPGHSGPVLGLAFSPDGERLAAGEFFRLSRLWSMRSNCLQQTVPNRSSRIAHLAFSGDGRWLAAVSDSGIQISETTSGREVQRFYPRSGRFVTAGFTPDGAIVAVSDDAGLRLWRSEPLALGAAARRPFLHILAIGINSYADPGLHLGYAQQDASELAAIFEQNPEALAYEPRSVRVLGGCATKSEIVGALEQIQSIARPEDAVMVFLAGHGRAEAGDFWFYTHRFRRSDALPGEALAVSEIARRVAAAPALRQILILDACQSGSAVERIRESFAKAAGGGRRLQILAASASTEDAMELEERGHGLLTSTLLERLRSRFQTGEAETVAGWLRFAVQRVPAIAAQYNKSGSQTPDWKSYGADFPLVVARDRVAAAKARPAAVSKPETAPPEFGEQFSCRATAADETFIRPEGITELLGDVVFRCAGRVSTPSIGIQVFINTNFTGGQPGEGRLETALVTETPGTRSDVAESAGMRGLIPSANMVAWTNVPVPSNGGVADTQFRITGLRANANGLGVSASAIPTQVVVFYQVVSPGLQLRAQQTVSYLSGRLQPRVGTCGGAGKPASSFVNDIAQNENLTAVGDSREGKAQYTVRFLESFPEQLLPAAARLGPGPLPHGLALSGESVNQGTRLVFEVNNLPDGVDLYATLSSLHRESSPGVRAKLVVTDVTGAGAYEPAKRNVVAVCEDESGSAAKLTVANGRAIAVWEVLDSDPNQIEAFVFGFMVAYRPEPAALKPYPGQVTFFTSYAPVSTITSANPRAPSPRFAMDSIARSFFAIELPSTRVLFPESVNQAGFDTSLQVENGGASRGFCTLSFAGSTSGGGPAPPPQTISEAIMPGQRMTYTLSTGGTHGLQAAPGFRGCIQALCRFRSVSGAYAMMPYGQQPGPLKPAIVLPGDADPKTAHASCDFR